MCNSSTATDQWRMHAIFSKYSSKWGEIKCMCVSVCVHSVSTVTFAVAQNAKIETTWNEFHCTFTGASGNDLAYLLQTNTIFFVFAIYFIAANRIWMGASCWSALRSEESPYTSRGKQLASKWVRDSATLTVKHCFRFVCSFRNVPIVSRCHCMATTMAGNKINSPWPYHKTIWNVL